MKKSLSFLVLFYALALILAGQTELLGLLTRESIIKGVPDWEAVIAAYTPKAESLRQLMAIQLPIRIEIYLGTWCPDSKSHVSAYFKILDMADNPLIQSVYIGVPRERAARSKYLPQAKNIEKLPTFLVIKDGQELGRIIETPAKSVEEDLIAILNR